MMLTVGPSIINKANVTACKKNLKEIGEQLIIMKSDRRQRNKKGWPRTKGVHFLLELTRGGKYAYLTGKRTKVFICPGTDDVNTTPDDSTVGSAYADLDNLDTYTISYAGRNQVVKCI